MTMLQKTFALLLSLVVLILIYFLSPILAPFLAGIIIAYLGDPLVDKLEEVRVHRTIGVLLVFLAFAAVLGTATLVILPLMARELAELIRSLPTFLAWLQETVSPWLVTRFGIDPFDVKSVSYTHLTLPTIYSV